MCDAFFSFEVKMNNVIIRDGERIDEVNENIRLIQKKYGLTFGSDAYLLAAYMKTQKNATAAELGTGTGIISLLCASRQKFKYIHAFEIQQEFAELTDRNTELNSLDDRMTCHCKDVRDITAEDTCGEVDAVFSNPPYMKTDSGKRNEADAKYIARHEVCGAIGDFAASASRLLKYGGRFYCVYRPDRLMSLLTAMRASKLEPKEMTFVHADANTPPSMVLVMAVKGGSESLKVTKPLLLHENYSGESKRELSRDAAAIYDTMSFDAFLDNK